MKKNVFPALMLVLVVVLVVGCHWPGLQGEFLLDDFLNLRPLGIYGGVSDWETFRLFVFNGTSGPTGRPLALSSFLLDDNAWPSHAGWFKPTNLAIHLLCGLLLCWCTLRLLRAHEFEERDAQWIAIFSGGCWLLHPLMVSTTLYVVQRMTQLAALFVFAGIAGYLNGRALLPARPRAAYAWMTISFGLGTLLAVFSKENGALLPLLLLVVEFCLPRTPSRPPPSALWRAVCLLLPSLALMGYLASLIDFSPDAWPERPFDQPERLWSEARILWEYLQLLFIPKIEGRGLFQDGYAISKGWLTPWTTLPSAFGIAALFGAALWMRRRWPLAALSLLFFFAGHLLESSVVGLELYFEHRNYLSAAFLFLPLGQGLLFLAKKTKPALAFVVGGLILSLLAGLTLERARLWQDADQLMIYWAVSNPDSPRAQNALADILNKRGQSEQADAVLQAAFERHPDNALLNLRLLLQKIYALKASAQDFETTGRRLAIQAHDAETMHTLQAIVAQTLLPVAPPFYKDGTLDLLTVMEHDAAFLKSPAFKGLVPLLKGRLYLAKGEPAEACRRHEQSISLYADIEVSLLVIAQIASAGLFDCASTTLTLAEKMFDQQRDRSLRRPRARYEIEIKRLREIIEQKRRQ